MFRLFRDGCVVTLMSLREIVAPVLLHHWRFVISVSVGRKWDVWKYFNFVSTIAVQQNNFVMIIIIE